MTLKNPRTVWNSLPFWIFAQLSLFCFHHGSHLRETAKMIGITLPIFFKSKHFYIHGVKNVLDQGPLPSALNPPNLTQIYNVSNYSNHSSQMKDISQM